MTQDEVVPGKRFRIWVGQNEGRIGIVESLSVNGLVHYTYDHDVRCVPATGVEWPARCLALEDEHGR